MPTYRARISGTGILVPNEGADPVVGFYTTRQVRAPDLESAKTVALFEVAGEWANGDYAESNKGEQPVLAAEEVWKVPLFKALFAKVPRGYAFFRYP